MSAPRSLNALQVAERLIGLGLCPVALRSPNDPSEQAKPAAKRGKTPFQRGWQSAPVPRSADDLDLTPDLNVGVRTGKTGAEFEVVAIDVDSEESTRWASEHLPPTPVKTYSGRAEAGWRGQHWFYKRGAGEAVGNRARISVRGADGKDKTLSIDVKADGGQVVAPGSVHGTGGAYEEVQPWTRELLATLPAFDWAWFPEPEEEAPSAADLFGAAPEDRELEALLAHPKNSQRRREQLPAAWRAGHKSVLPELAHLDPRVLLAGAPTPKPCPLRVFSESDPPKPGEREGVYWHRVGGRFLDTYIEACREAFKAARK